MCMHLQAGSAEGPSDHVRGLARHLLHRVPHTGQTGMCVLSDDLQYASKRRVCTSVLLRMCR